MKSLVISGVGRANLFDVPVNSQGVPPMDCRMYRQKPAEFAQKMVHPETSFDLLLDILVLPIHKMYGCPVEIAYWPSTWLDRWGVTEVCKYFGIDEKREDYGTSAYSYVSDAVDVRSPVRVDFPGPKAPQESYASESSRRSRDVLVLPSVAFREIER